jgi:hypothetical protein
MITSISLKSCFALEVFLLAEDKSFYHCKCGTHFLRFTRFWGKGFLGHRFVHHKTLNFVSQIFFSFYAKRLANYAVPNWLTSDEYLQGLGLTQSLPGPLFNFCLYRSCLQRPPRGAPCMGKRHNLTFKVIIKNQNEYP